MASVVRISIAPVKALGLVHPDEVTLTPPASPATGASGSPTRTAASSTASGTARSCACGPSGTRRRAASRSPFRTATASRASSSWASPSPPRCTACRCRRTACAGRGRTRSPSTSASRCTLFWADGGAVDRGQERRHRLARLARIARAAARGVGSRTARRRAALQDAVRDRRRRRARGGRLARRAGAGRRGRDRLNGDVGRCAVTTQDPDTGVRDLDTLDALAGYRREGRTEDLPFGVYGAVAVPGASASATACSGCAARADIARPLY